MNSHIDSHSFFQAYERKADKNYFSAAETSEYAHDLAAELKLHFLKIVRDVLSLQEVISKRERERIEQEEKDSLSIEVYDKLDLIKSRLQDFGYSVAKEQVLSDETLLVIKLSEPLRKNLVDKTDLTSEEKVWKKIYDEAIS